MSLPVRYLELDAQLHSLVKDQAVLEGPKALAPGTPLLILAHRHDGSPVSIDVRAVGSRRIRVEPLTYEVRVRLINLSRDVRQWLESAVGSRSA